MTRRGVLGGVLVVLVVAAALGAAVYTGVGPAPGTSDPIEDFPTAESADDETKTTAAGDADPFSFAIDETDTCGTTCRDVTATLYNEQTETATGVTAYIRIVAGENRTDTDDVVWEGTVDVGSLEAGGSHTITERIELSLEGARAVDRADGWVTIQTTVDSDAAIVTLQTSERLA
jgi:hypothetical protein